jgi:hypothetical protein
MNNEPLDERYFEWLAVQVVNIRLKSRVQTNWHVLRKLFTTEFVWRIRNDDNRVGDGKELRGEFLESNPDIQATYEWMNEGCSFLEMLIALSRRLAFLAEGASSTQWFWHLLDNVGLHVSDLIFEARNMDTHADRVLSMINTRTYNQNGEGGLFPLHDAEVDQTTVEIWYQMNYYLLERN